MEMKEIIRLAEEAGFSHAAALDMRTMELREDVRDMCSSNSCGMYGKNWACPPACGELEECRARIEKYTAGILVQTVGAMEDSWDYESMMEIEAEHKKYFFTVNELLKKEYPDLLALGAGCCTICRKCTCPDQPCRFPEKRISSLEAYGILVSDLCKRNHLGYYFGSRRISYTSCFLFQELGDTVHRQYERSRSEP